MFIVNVGIESSHDVA